MTPKQKRFCDEYPIDCSASKAALRAGYSPKCAKQIGCELLTRPEIRDYINEKLKSLENQNIADTKEVMEYLTSVMRGEHTEQTLKFIGDGVQAVTDISVSEKDRLKAAELIGKRYGMFKDNLNMTGAAPVVIAGAEKLED